MLEVGKRLKLAQNHQIEDEIQKEETEDEKERKKIIFNKTVESAVTIISYLSLR